MKTSAYARLLILVTSGLLGLLMASFTLADAPSEKAKNQLVIPQLDCVIEPSEIVDVGTAVPGVVETFEADRSDMVKQGAVLARLESSVERVALELARARAGLDTAIELRKQSAAFGKITQKRNQSLLLKSAISKQDMDQLKTETSIAELQVRQERENKRIAGLEELRAEAVLQRRTIRSPVEGVVMDRFKSVGEYVENEPLLRIAKLDPLHVEVIVPVTYLGMVKPGMQAEVAATVPDALTYLARVERVDRVADAASGTFGVLLSLENPEYRIPAGLRCSLGFLPFQQQAQGEQIVESRDQAPVSEEPLAQAGTMAADEMNTLVETASSTRPQPTVVADAQAESQADTSTFAEPSARVEDVSLSCRRIGPILDEEKAQLLAEYLSSHSETLNLSQESYDEPRYQVLVLESGEQEAREALISRLDKAGFSHRYPIKTGDFKGRLSLGFYRNQAIAMDRIKKLTRKGFNVELKETAIKTVSYWLNFSLDMERLPAGPLEEIGTMLPSTAKLESSTCNQAIVSHLN